MAEPRRWASVLLRWVTKIAPPPSREWAEAMLRELDFVEGEWAAFFWALGCAWVVAQYAAMDWVTQRAKNRGMDFP
jgi:hypothetical protein